MNATPPTTSGKRRSTWLVVLAIGLALGAWFVRRSTRARVDSSVRAPVAPTADRARLPEARFVGSDACAPCHAAETSAWKRSHHAKAMATATESTVLGRFDGSTIRNGDDESLRFIRDADGFAVEVNRRIRTPPRTTHDTTRLGVAYTFGVDPLQQLLVRGVRGRLQALTVAWDARAARDGGQRWYALDADAPSAAGDPFHFTGRMYTWNFMCADCHSTFVERRYDAASDAYDTRFAALDVGCEACHGPASNHLDPIVRTRPGRGLVTVLASDHAWVSNATTGSPLPHAVASEREVETCAPCHARRESIAASHRPGSAFLDSYRPVLATEPAYFADGRIRDEDFEWTSFTESRMFHAGVACSDCHEPHTAGLRAEGNALCTRCHAEARFDTARHRRHADGSAGSACVACHMPSRTYMGIDVRHDHSLRVPSPALSAALGSPDGCTSCHTGRDATWAEATLRATRSERYDAWRDAYLIARRDRSAEGLLAVVRDATIPVGVRAAALESLTTPPSRALFDGVAEGARDRQAVLRLAAATSAAALPPEWRVRVASSLLGDARRAVRLEAARSFVDIPGAALDSAVRALRDAAVDELLASERVNEDRPEAWMRIALVERARGRFDAAERAYGRAKQLAPELVAIDVNLADLARERGDEEAAERHLAAALARAPNDAMALHASGLSRVRRGQLRDALPLLERAAKAQPDDPHLLFVWILSLREAGEREAARRALVFGLARFPDDPELGAIRSLDADLGR